MYGKIYPSLYSGSMFGAGFAVMALWPYVIATARIDEDSSVELNPPLLSAIFGESVDSIEKAITYLCSPDPGSRTTKQNGRRLIKIGAFKYRVVNLEKYRDSKTDDAKRKYWKEYRRKRREAGKDTRNPLIDNKNVQVNANSVQVNVQHADADADADADAVPLTGGGIKKIAVEVKERSPKIPFENCLRWLSDWRRNGAQYTETQARSAWLALEANGWMWGRNPVTDYRAALERQIQTDLTRVKPLKPKYTPNI